MDFLNKNSVMSLVFLLLGMSLFVIFTSVPLPTVPFPMGLFGLMMCALLLGLSKLFLHFENRSLSEVNLVPDSGTAYRFIIGFSIGAVIVGCMLLAVFSLTNVSLTRSPDQFLVPFLLSSLVIVPLALMEEILFRGYPFFRLSNQIHIRWVILITAVMFGLYHLNDNTSLISVLLGPGVWGLVFGVAAYISRSIAVSLGIHVAANFLQAIFDMNQNVSAMWKLSLIEDTTQYIIDVETLGLIMQLVLLVGSVIALEMYLKKQK